jgi:hypothetical protein
MSFLEPFPATLMLRHVDRHHVGGTRYSMSDNAHLCGHFLWGSNTSNKPFEWPGHHHLPASPSQTPCLPLKGSVQREAVYLWLLTPEQVP